MTSFRVLDGGLPQHRDQWIKLWSSWPEREVYAHPDYVRLFAGDSDCCICAVTGTEADGVLFPLILRPTRAEEWADPRDETWDLITPYGYGGPFAWGSPDVGRFWDDFDQWTHDAKIVSLFARLSLFPEQCIPFRGTIEQKGMNIVRSLNAEISEIWMDYAAKVRKNVKKAERSGLRVEIDLAGERIDDFIVLYDSTMNRRQAAGWYYFSRQFFQTIVKAFQGQFAFFHALHDHTVVSSELVLVSTNHLYSFLGGTLAEAFDLRPNDLLKHAVIQWGRKMGKLDLVLGGGYRERDGVFRYKKSFAPRGEVAFRVGKRVYDVEAYDRLLDTRRNWEATRGGNWQPDPGYFPEYRA